MTGAFITVEGGEGAGKTTQLQMLAGALRARGCTLVTTREPGGTPGAETLRHLLLAGAETWSPLAETMLHFAARADHADRVIRPALARGATVLSDRFADSTLAYQGYGQGADRHAIEALTALIGVSPTLTLIFEVTPETARARLATRGAGADRYERLGADFHARVAAGFRAIAAAAPNRCVLIGADGAPEEVHAAVLRILDERLFS